MTKQLDLSKAHIETNRLILRNFNNADLYDFHEYAREPGVGELSGWRHHESIDESKRVIDMFICSKRVLAIALKDSNRVIGSISIDYDSFREPSNNSLFGVVIGYVLGKAYWHMGYMSEVLREIERYLFLDLEVDFIEASHYISNIRSQRLLVKRGYSIVKYFDYKTHFNTIERAILRIKYRKDYLATLEHVALYDSNLLPAGKWIYRGARVPDGYYRGVVDIIIKNTRYDRYLVTKRDKNKESHPSKYEATGGAISFNEKENISAMREVYEETGIKLAEDKLKFLYKTTLGSAVFFEYYAECDCELDTVVLQKGETEEYHWLTREEYIKLFKSDLVAERQKIRLARALEEFI